MAVCIAVITLPSVESLRSRESLIGIQFVGRFFRVVGRKEGKQPLQDVHGVRVAVRYEMDVAGHGGVNGGGADVNANFSVQFDHVTEYLHSVQEKLPLRDYYSKTTYFRLFIAEMFPEIDKAIYIDSDTVVLGDIAQEPDFLNCR